jgi:signal transduction histidine kinase
MWPRTENGECLRPSNLSECFIKSSGGKELSNNKKKVGKQPESCIDSPKIGTRTRFTFPRANDQPEYSKSESLAPNLSHQSAAEQRARAAQRIAALGEMTGGIAHDFRNILAIIESGLRLAEKSAEAPEQVRTCIAGAKEGVDRGLRLISQLLTFAKQQELAVGAADANQLLTELEPFLKYGAGPAISIGLELASDIPECFLDPTQFNAAVLNLVVNARDAMPNGGNIRISTKRCQVRAVTVSSAPPRVYVRVRVEDGGQGMPAEVLPQIFDPLFTTKGEKGTGLGLPQVGAFMRLIGGHVDVTSQLGAGTSVDLFFPSSQPVVGVPFL